jgi:hypothetical protein
MISEPFSAIPITMESGIPQVTDDLGAVLRESGRRGEGTDEDRCPGRQGTAATPENGPMISVQPDDYGAFSR